jgi:DNA-binding PadR family transcriptional regulator
MASANRTAYAILGLLAQGSKTGYEIKQVVETTISHFWKESYGHIYPTLSQLIAQGYVTREEQGDGRSGGRSRYQITAAGEEALSAWLAQPTEAAGTRNELALKLYFGSLTTLAVSRAHLEAHREQHQHLLERFARERPRVEEHVAAGTPGARYELIALSLGLHISAARVSWCEEALRLLERDERGSGDERPSASQSSRAPKVDSDEPQATG